MLNKLIGAIDNCDIPLKEGLKILRMKIQLNGILLNHSHKVPINQVSNLLSNDLQ